MMYLPFTDDLVFLLLVLQSEDIQLTFHHDYTPACLVSLGGVFLVVQIVSC